MTDLARRLVLALAIVSSFACFQVDDPGLDPVDDPRFDAPLPPLRDVGRDENRNVFFGDLHIHTSHSFDAYTMGVRAFPDDAYTYCKGGTIQHGIGYPIRASAPLDFAAVTDHAEYLGFARDRDERDPAWWTLRDVLETENALLITLNFIYTGVMKMGTPERRDESFGTGDLGVSRSAWQETIASAERHYVPGRFTTFIAYEWTSMPDGRNLHRNVVYRGTQVPDLPHSSVDSKDPRDLWAALDAQREQGMQVLAIPHNGNVSDGRMYDRVAFDGSAFDAGYATTRMANEPISEIFQVKGASETHPAISPEDEFANFEIFDQVLDASGDPSRPAGSYVRDAFRSGLEMQVAEGFNPYRFGLIGSSDSHNASAAVEEKDHHGKLPLLDGTPALRLGISLLLPENQQRGLRWGSGGLAGVWAEENTREALFDAMARKETYATSGTRITVRFFGGFDYDEVLLGDPDRIEKAYARGVSMGGTLAMDTSARAPRFIVLAAKDPIGANLDRLQIVKGWVDDAGASHERIYDVAASDGRRIEAGTHRASALPSTVDLAQATYENRVGAAQLSAFWEDPDFDPDVPAFYYARVLEIETPRWSTYDAKRMGIEPPEPATLQERAVTSPIWVDPAG